MCAWARRETQDLPLTRGIEQEQNASPARGVSNEAGDSVPGSQDSLTRRVHNLQLSESPATQTAPPVPAPPPLPHARRPTQTRARQQRQEYLRCAQCGPDPAAFKGATDHGLMLQMVQKHGGQQLIQETLHNCAISNVPLVFSVARSGRGGVTAAASAKAILQTRDLIVGDTFQDRRQPEHQCATRSINTMIQITLQKVVNLANHTSVGRPHATPASQPRTQSNLMNKPFRIFLSQLTKGSGMIFLAYGEAKGRPLEYRISKKVTSLVRHVELLIRETDGAVHRTWMGPKLRQEFQKEGGRSKT